MVKPLKIFGHSIKWFVLLSLLAVIGVGLWLHTGERSLSFAKPWVLKAINSPDAPYSLGIGDVTLNWTNAAELGKLRIKDITFAKRDGNVFAQFPEVTATLDPLGFLPDRHLLHRVRLREPRMFVVRNAEGNVEFGFENAAARMPLAELIAFLTAEDTTDNAPTKRPVLPFRSLVIDKATFTFTDEKSGTEIASDAFSMRLQRHHNSYDAALSLPFMVDAEPVLLTAGLRALPKTRSHVLAVRMQQMPSRLICLFDTCPAGVEAEGSLNATLAIGIYDKDLSVHGFNAKLATNKAKITMPEIFAEPLKLGASTAEIEGDWSKQIFLLKHAKLQLPDTSISAKGTARHDKAGWYVAADASCTKIDVRKLYKYWPLVMAPDSRTWVTSKLKSGYAASGTLKLNLTPEDFAAEYFSDASVDAIVDAREITFEYLSGFPLVEKMNGIAHFTGTTLNIEGKGGRLMSGTTINQARLWCPKLHSTKNPMEATLDITAPATDVATMLALEHFKFDDHLKLDAKTIRGTVDADMKLKFNAFSENPKDTGIHLDAVDYDIKTTLKHVAQKNIHEGYDIHAINGVLTADVNQINFDGSVDVGEAEVNDVKLSQTYGKPMTLTVKGRAGKEPRPLNDFTLSYQSGEIPVISLSGKRLDGSVSYGRSENSILADFPAMDLNIDLGELVLAKEAPFTEVKGTMRCTKQRCESANVEAKAGAADVRASINQITGKRQLVLYANDAGATLKALDITDRMEKGKLELKGDYDDSKTPPHLDARFLITDFNLKNSQILARIFSIGSLTGLQNAMTGSGIAFEKLSSNLGSRAGIIEVGQGVARGASMGITFEGSVDTNTTRLNLKGVLAPAYALNSILGKIPIIGAIAGGDEGLIAFNYSVKGTYSDPDVSVNPLSGLTPGFLRGIFGGGDAKEDKVKQRDNRPVGTKTKSHVKRAN